MSLQLPNMSEIPDEFKGHVGDGNPFVAFVDEWFFDGADRTRLTAKPGVDADSALMDIGIHMRSFSSKHEHKIAGCAYLLSQSFEVPR